MAEQVISAAEANRSFSKLLRTVRSGSRYVVTTHGRPVARIIPFEGAAKDGAKEALLARLEQQPIVDIGTWTRDELYERDH
jgi:prevent-host-death family protein